MGNSQSVVGVWTLVRWGNDPFLDFGPAARGRLHLETPPVASRNGDARDILEWVRCGSKTGQ